MNDDDDLSIRITSTLSLSKQCRKYRKYQCPTMEIPQFRPVRRMTRVFPYTHTKAKHRVWNVGNHKNLFTYDRKRRKKSVSLRVMKFPLPYYLLWGRGTKGREEEKFSARKKCWENRPQNHSKKTSSHWATRPPRRVAVALRAGGRKKGKRRGFPLEQRPNLYPKRGGPGARREALRAAETAKIRL